MLAQSQYGVLSTHSGHFGITGFRGLEIEGKFKKFTATGIYIERSIISHLALTWKGKTVHELNNSLGFFMDIVTCKPLLSSTATFQY